MADVDLPAEGAALLVLRLTDVSQQPEQSWQLEVLGIAEDGAQTEDDYVQQAAVLARAGGRSGLTVLPVQATSYRRARINVVVNSDRRQPHRFELQIVPRTIA